MPNSQTAIQVIPAEVLKLARELDLFTVPGTTYHDYDEYLVDEVGGYAQTGKLYYVKIYQSGRTECECRNDSPCLHVVSALLYREREVTTTESLEAFITRLDLSTCSIIGCYNPATKPGSMCYTHLAELASYSDLPPDQAAPQLPPATPIAALSPTIETELHHPPPWSLTQLENLSSVQPPAAVLALPKPNP
jgi:hypothetical protein